jgi:hypothetical protein
MDTSTDVMEESDRARDGARPHPPPATVADALEGGDRRLKLRKSASGRTHSRQVPTTGPDHRTGGRSPLLSLPLLLLPPGKPQTHNAHERRKNRTHGRGGHKRELRWGGSRARSAHGANLK